MSLLLARRGSLAPRRAAGGDTYQDVVLADSPIAYWPMQETSGSTVADAVGSLDGTVVGATLGVSTGLAALGNGVTFDGADDYITMGSQAALNLTTGITVETWASWDGTTGVPVIMGNGDQGYILRYTVTGGSIRFLFYNGSGWVGQSGGSMTQDVLYHIVATYDSSDFVLYQNETQVGTSGETSTINQPGTAFALGTDFQSGPRRYWGGMMAHSAVYNYALSSARVEAHFAAGTAS